MLWGKPSSSQIEYPEHMEAAKDEGKRSCVKLYSHVRFVLARKNHHVHLPTKKGRIPL